MGPEIRLQAVAEDLHSEAPADGSAALMPSREALLTLRFAISTPDRHGLDALRHARRSMLREEWTLGRDPGEPSLEAAMFSSTEVAWTVPRSQRERCLERLTELERRANRALLELQSS
ncbi:MAG TPA: hypothetical protein VMR54_06490 [Thermoanaerobaculia bacterium]|nr:hypothetical protein [Thermoanaerobaculia bacterium]